MNLQIVTISLVSLPE